MKTRYHVADLVQAGIGIMVLALIVGIVVIPASNAAATAQNNTLNFTAANRYATTSVDIVEWTSLGNTSTTLTRDTHYRVHFDNDTIELVNSPATNTTGCGVHPHTQNCNYFARYQGFSGQSGRILQNVPVLLAVMVIVAVAGMVLYAIRR